MSSFAENLARPPTSRVDLSWVINAYVLTFGGFLLLGGRLADLLGRRRMFMLGVLVFSLASLAGGLAQSEGWLLAARAVQGVGAAIVSPAALSILTSLSLTVRSATGHWGSGVPCLAPAAPPGCCSAACSPAD
jgi:MFS family permease